MNELTGVVERYTGLCRRNRGLDSERVRLKQPLATLNEAMVS